MGRECRRTTGTRGRLVRTGIPRAESVHETYPLPTTIDVVAAAAAVAVSPSIHTHNI